MQQAAYDLPMAESLALLELWISKDLQTNFEMQVNQCCNCTDLLHGSTPPSSAN